MNAASTRVPISEWLKAVESPTGPLPPELRHACLTLARFMSGDGSAGCFPGTRALGLRIGVNHATVARWLLQLVKLGWLERDLRKRQFGRPGGHYFPTLPMSHSDATINGGNVAPHCDNPGNVASEADSNVALDPINVARDVEIVAPSVRPTLTEVRTEKSAASPALAHAGSAAPNSEARERIADLYGKGFKPSEIVKFREFTGLTLAEVHSVTNNLDRKAK